MGSSILQRKKGRRGGRRSKAHADLRLVSLLLRTSSLRKNAEQQQKGNDLEDNIKYGGQTRTRKQIFDDDDEEISEEEEGGAGGDDDGDEDEDMENDDGAQQDEDDNDEEDEEEDEASEDGGQPHASSSSKAQAPSLETTQILSSIRQSRSEDVAKGLGVKRQLELFEKVMPLRIRLQKAVVGIEEVKVSSRKPFLQSSLSSEFPFSRAWRADLLFSTLCGGRRLRS